MEERAPDAAYVNDETPRVYLMVDDRGKAAKLLTLLNDRHSVQSAFPGNPFRSGHQRRARPPRSGRRGVEGRPGSLYGMRHWLR